MPVRSSACRRVICRLRKASAAAMNSSVYSTCGRPNRTTSRSLGRSCSKSASTCDNDRSKYPSASYTGITIENLFSIHSACHPLRISFSYTCRTFSENLYIFRKHVINKNAAEVGQKATYYTYLL